MVQPWRPRLSFQPFETFAGQLIDKTRNDHMQILSVTTHKMITNGSRRNGGVRVEGWTHVTSEAVEAIAVPCWFTESLLKVKLSGYTDVCGESAVSRGEPSRCFWS